MKLLLITTALACIGLLTFATHIAAAQDPEQPQPGETESTEEPEQPQPGQTEKEEKEEKSGLDMLREAERTARDVAENHLRKQKVGKETQDKEEEIIKAFDDLIEFILENQAQQEQQQQGQQGQCQSGQQSSQQSNKMGGSEPSSMAGKTANPQKGKATGFQKPSGKGDSEGKQKEEWGFLPDKDFEATAREESAELPPGYQRLIERYRRVVITEMTKIRR